MEYKSEIKDPQESEPVTKGELNSWRRGFTPQAEIWNGRMAMVAIFVSLMILLFARWSIS